MTTDTLAHVVTVWEIHKLPMYDIKALAVWSLLYSYSFEQKSDWTREYPGQEEILVNWMADTPLLQERPRESDN